MFFLYKCCFILLKIWRPKKIVEKSLGSLTSTCACVRPDTRLLQHHCITSWRMNGAQRLDSVVLISLWVDFYLFVLISRVHMSVRCSRMRWRRSEKGRAREFNKSVILCYRTMTDSTKLSNNNRLLPDLKCYFIHFSFNLHNTANVFIMRLVFVRRHLLCCSSSSSGDGSGDTCRKNIRQRYCVIVYDGKKGESLKKWLESHFIYYHDRCKNATTLNIRHVRHLHKAHDGTWEYAIA